MCDSCGCATPGDEKPRSKVEVIKGASNYLRGNIPKELASNSTHFSEDDYQVLKFHGVYQQDDRDLRRQLKQEGKDKHWIFMIRVRIPGGILTSEQYLVCDDLASRYADQTLRVTTRQGFQFHGVLKDGLKPTLRSINEALITTLGACGDLERNVMCCPAPASDRVRSRVQEYAQLISDHLLPKTGAYHEIWLNGEKTYSGEPDDEPIYGRHYLPRKFKTGLAFGGDNCVDVYTHDIGLVADFDGEELRGFNVLVGGGMGMTHNNPATYPRLATPIAYVEPAQLLETVETIVLIQRDHGDRKNRKHARLKYLMDDWGAERFKAEMERRLQRELEPARNLAPPDVDDHLGWHPQGDGRWYLGVFVENGRIKDEGDLRMKSAFRRIVRDVRPGIRLTPQHNILFTDIPDQRRHEVETILNEHGIVGVGEVSNTLRYSMACPALPTCGLAMSDSERALPAVVREMEREIAQLGLADEHISIRMTGCPNGCTRPYVGDIGFVGRTLNAYVIYLGGDFEGTRLNHEFADMVPTEKLVERVRPVLEHYKQERHSGERFGDFCERIGVDRLREMFPPPGEVKRSGDGESEPARIHRGRDRRRATRTRSSSTR